LIFAGANGNAFLAYAAVLMASLIVNTVSTSAGSANAAFRSVGGLHTLASARAVTNKNMALRRRAAVAFGVALSIGHPPASAGMATAILFRFARIALLVLIGIYQAVAALSAHVPRLVAVTKRTGIATGKTTLI